MSFSLEKNINGREGNKLLFILNSGLEGQTNNFQCSLSNGTMLALQIP